jgi:hypothetical protein
VTTHNACLAPDAAAGDPSRHDIATDLPSRRASFAPASVVMDACEPILPSSASPWQTDAAASCSFRNVIIPPVAGGPRRCGHWASSLACITSYWLCGGCFDLYPILASAHRLDGRAHPLLPRQPLIAPNLGGGLGGRFARMLNCSFCRIKLLSPLFSCTVTVRPASQVRWLSANAGEVCAETVVRKKNNLEILSHTVARAIPIRLASHPNHGSRHQHERKPTITPPHQPWLSCLTHCRVSN